MKRLLLPIEAASAAESTFATADLIRKKFGSQVDAVAIRPVSADFVPYDHLMVTSLALPGQSAEEVEQAARRTFDRLCNAIRSADPEGAKQFRWPQLKPLHDIELGMLSRVFDITIVGRPGREVGAPRSGVLEAALFESGKPIIMAPPTAPVTIGTNVLIHWNASSETARTVTAALPLLLKADVVSLLSVEGNMVEGPSAADMLQYLAAHGIRATEKRVPPSARGGGEAILAEAKRIGADLLVKGAYTQSRLRQMIFGGATQHVLQAAHLPVILSH